MTRDEAIDYVWELTHLLYGDFYKRERDVEYEKTRQALLALGVALEDMREGER